MGLSASQVRYLALTARKSDIEYEAQVINNARIELANKSSDATKAYTERMNNKIIRIASGIEKDTGLKTWTELTFENAQEKGYQIIGGGGDSLIPSPYSEYLPGTNLSAEEYNSLSEIQKSKCTLNENGTYTVNTLIRGGINENYNGMDIQSLLVSARGQIVSEQFFDFLCAHGYGTGKYFSLDADGKPAGETSYKELVEEFQSNSSNKGINTVVDWRSDVSNMFKETLYTEDDAQALAEYEAATAEIQSQDKQLELKLKGIETEHKAIETELEAVKKVVDKNIESSYKTFG